MENTIVEGTLETNICPEQVLDVLEIPQLIPRWAPAFADQVERHGQSEWQVTKNDTVFRIEVESSRTTQTVGIHEEDWGRQEGWSVFQAAPSNWWGMHHQDGSPSYAPVQSRVCGDAPSRGAECAC